MSLPTENLKKYIHANSGLDTFFIDKIITYFTPLKINRNTVLLSEGEVAKHFYYIHKGCLRTYYINNEGIVKTRHIAFEDSLIGSLSSFISQNVSYEFVESIEDSEIFSISHSDFFMLTNEIPKWEKFYLILLEKGYVFQNRKIESYVTLSAKQRYEKLLKEDPHFITRLSNIIVASYLDISPETLSRLKSK